MAIRHKRKNSAGYTWQAGDLVEGQIGLNIADGTLHFDKADGSTVTIAPSTGGGITDIVQDTTPQLGGNLDVQSNSITTSVTNGNISLTPNGTGDVQLDADTVRIGDNNTAATITTHGTGNLILNTNAGTNSGTITINQGINGAIDLEPHTDGQVWLTSAVVRIGDVNSTAILTTNGTGSLILNTNDSSAASGNITINQGANQNISITPNGTGDVQLNADTVRVGDNNTLATITTQGTGSLTLSTNSGTNSGTITINQGIDASIELAPNGTGDVLLTADTVRIGDAAAAVTLTTNGAGTLTLNTNNGTSTGSIVINQGANSDISITTAGTGDLLINADTIRMGDANQTATITSQGTGNLVLSTNSGTNSGTITITQGANNNIILSPNGNGRVSLETDTMILGDANAAATVTTNGTGNLTLNTNNNTNSGTITITQGANNNIAITPNGTGQTVITNLEYNENVFAFGNSGAVAITPNAANGNIQTITATGNFTLNAFTSPVSGQTITFVITQDAVGGRTLTSTMRFAGGSKTLSTAANAIDILTVSYIGTTYYASLAKGYV